MKSANRYDPQTISVAWGGRGVKWYGQVESLGSRVERKRLTNSLGFRPRLVHDLLNEHGVAGPEFPVDCRIAGEFDGNFECRIKADEIIPTL